MKTNALAVPVSKTTKSIEFYRILQKQSPRRLTALDALYQGTTSVGPLEANQDLGFRPCAFFSAKMAIVSNPSDPIEAPRAARNAKSIEFYRNLQKQSLRRLTALMLCIRARL
jgi:hypothetical protein